MPTILRIDGFRFFFYSLEGNEPPHVHVEQNDKVAKFWLEPLRLAQSDGFRSKELTRLRWLIVKHRTVFLEAWHGHFDSDSSAGPDGH